MAAETHLEYNKKGFWILEFFVEVLSEFICQVYESNGLNSYSQNLIDIYEDCDANRKGYNIGMANILFDEYIINTFDKDVMLTTLEQTKSIISSFGAEISINDLNQMEKLKNESLRRIWNTSIKTSSLISTINIIQEMLNGTWNSNNHMVNYIGFPHLSSESAI